MRLMILRGSILFDAALLAVLLILIYAFFHQHNRFSNPSSVVPTLPTLNLVALDQHGKKRQPVSDISKLIDTRIKLIPDVRSRECKRNSYILTEKASLVIDFNDYQFYDLKNTLQSILNQNYDQLLEELIIIDDGSTLEYIRQDVETYLQTIPKARLVRFKTQQGTLKARIAAMGEVKTDIVVFLEANVICGIGWLEPLIDLLIKDRNVIALPHYDRIKSPVSLEYQTTSRDLNAVPNWNFGIKMRSSKELQDELKGQKYFFASPALRGNTFALRKSFLDSIGSFDGNFEEGGGDVLELSLRTWMCGGMIETAICSRVGIINFDDQLKPYSQRNCQRVAGLWYGNLKEVALRLGGIPTTLSETDEAQISTRLRYITSRKECRDIQWYLQNVARESIIPTPNAVKFGILFVMTGRCARVAGDMKIDLLDCNDIRQNRTGNEMFELTTSGHLMVNGKCTTTENTAYIMLRDCRGDDRQQLWTFKGMELRNMWSNFCATHVTDPDVTIKNRQIMMAQNCEIPQEHKAFNQLQFQLD